MIKSGGYNISYMSGEDIYYEAYFWASQFTLKAKTLEFKKKKTNQLALDYYGLMTFDS
jgi:hypothetical protein